MMEHAAPDAFADRLETRAPERERALYATQALEGLNKRVAWSVRPRDARHDTLVVVLSSKSRFELGGVPMAGHAVLDVADRLLAYYVAFADPMIAAIHGFIRDNGFRSVCFLGASKGAFGALMTSREIAALSPDVTVSALAFSPQVTLWPANPHIKYPTYRSLLGKAEENRRILRSLKTHGDQSRPVEAPNLRRVVFHSVGNKTDAREVGRLSGDNLVVETLPSSTHSTILTFLCSGMDRQGIQRVMDALTRKAATDADLALDFGAQAHPVVEEILTMAPRPTLDALINWTMNWRDA